MTQSLVAVSAEDRLRQAFAAYNRQDVEALLALVSADVHWATDLEPLSGKKQLRSYWERQWVRTRTHDEVLHVVPLSDTRFVVALEQVVRSVEGELLSTGRYDYVFALENGLIQGLLSISRKDADSHRQITCRE